MKLGHEMRDILRPPIPGFPNLGYMYPQGYICLSAGIHLRLAIEDKSTVYLDYMLFISKYLYIYQLILIPKVICLLLNISMNNHGKIFCHKKF